MKQQLGSQCALAAPPHVSASTVPLPSASHSRSEGPTKQLACIECAGQSSTYYQVAGLVVCSAASNMHLVLAQGFCPEHTFPALLPLFPRVLTSQAEPEHPNKMPVKYAQAVTIVVMPTKSPGAGRCLPSHPLASGAKDWSAQFMTTSNWPSVTKNAQQTPQAEHCAWHAKVVPFAAQHNKLS